MFITQIPFDISTKIIRTGIFTPPLKKSKIFTFKIQGNLKIQNPIANFYFPEEARRANQKVLVHCLAGISRSPTLAIAYVMRSKALTCDEAYKFVKARRPSVSPNLNFMGQLFLYESQLRAKKILPPALRPRSNIIEDYNPPPPAEDLPHTQMVSCNRVII